MHLKKLNNGVNWLGLRNYEFIPFSHTSW
jgi:hypothetical protein